MGTKTFLPILFDDFSLDFSERLNEKRKIRKIQKKKFLKEKTNKIKKRKNHITSMEIPMYFLDKEILKKANIDLKSEIKSIKIICKKSIIENVLSYNNQIEIKEINKQLNWLENEILEKINKNGYFDTIYEEFEFCINDKESNSSNYIYYEYIEKMLNHRFKNDFFEIKEKDISSRGFSYEFIFNKEKIAFRLELGKNLKRKLIEIINNREIKENDCGKD
jgi:hypothetical protein